MILSILHYAQWGYTLVCVPLFGFLVYALAKEAIKHVIASKTVSEYNRGYAKGYRDGHDAALLARVVDVSWFEDDREED